jgi:hypothetical protein
MGSPQIFARRTNRFCQFVRKFLTGIVENSLQPSSGAAAYCHFMVGACGLGSIPGAMQAGRIFEEYSPRAAAFPLKRRLRGNDGPRLGTENKKGGIK